MSNRAIDAVRDFSQTKGSERLLLFMIAEGINKSTGVYRALISTLMADCNMSESWVHKLVGKLILRGELIVFDNPGHSSDFFIPIYGGELGYDPQPCAGEGHTCNGRHTSLSVDRETVRREEWAAQRRQQRTSRKLSGVDGSTPPDENTENDERGVSQYTPGCIPVHPRVDGSTPPGGREYTQYPSSYPLDLPLDVPGPVSPSSQKKARTAKTAAKSSNDEAGETATVEPIPPPPPTPPARDGSDPARLWKRVKDHIRSRQLGAAAIGNWIDPVRLVALEDNGAVLFVTLACPGSEHARILAQRYHGLLIGAFGALTYRTGSHVEIEYTTQNVIPSPAAAEALEAHA